MAGIYINRANPLRRHATDKGYRVAWKLRYGFERGILEGELTFAEASKKAGELGSEDHDKVYWAEMIMDPKFHM